MRAIDQHGKEEDEKPLLWEHEFEALLCAVRRDLRRELRALGDTPEEVKAHMFNIRMDRRILDVLRPKSAAPGMYLPR